MLGYFKFTKLFIFEQFIIKMKYLIITEVKK